MASYLDALKEFVLHPVDSLGVLFTPAVSVDGPPTLTGNMLTFGSGQPVDSIVSAQQRAYGVDPFTGELIAPQYATAAGNAGYDPANPKKFLDQVRADALGFYNGQLAANSSGDSSANWTLPLLVILILLFVFLKVVK